MTKFNVCWWNTGLAPPKGTTNERAHLAQVADAVNMLMSKRDVDILCLGEVNSTTFDFLKSIPEASNLTFVDTSVGPDGTAFNLGIVYKANSLSLSDLHYYTTSIEQMKKKTAQSLDVTLRDGSVFTLFLVHWPSRLLLPPESITRVLLGHDLRSKIDNLLEKDPHHNIIVMGDFNDEPYNDSVSRTLGATRDIEMTRRNTKLLYNPFWKYFANGDKYSMSSSGSEASGTYYYASGKIHRWRTFDQILFSSSFMGTGVWHLNEEETVIWEQPALLDVGPGKSKTIDHLPVFGTIERQAAHGLV